MFLPLHIPSSYRRWPVVATMLLSLAPAYAQVMSLQQCIDSALVNERRILMAGIDTRIAEERTGELRGALLPKLRGVVDYKYYTDLPYQLMPASIFGGPADMYREIQFGTPQNVAANLALQVPLYDPASFSAVQVGKEAAAMAAIQHERTREDVVMEVSAVYYNAQILQSRLAFLDSNVVNAAALVRTLELLHGQTLARRTDVDRIALQRDQLTTQRTQVQGQYEQVLDGLKVLTGMPLDASLSVDTTAPAAEVTSTTTGSTTQRRMADQALRLRNAELRTLKRARLPGISGQGLYGTTGFGPLDTDDHFNFYPIGYLGLQLQVPLFQGTMLAHRIKSKQFELERTELQRDALQDKENVERRSVQRQLTIAEQAIVNNTAQLALAQRIRRSTMAQHAQGLATVPDLILAEQGEHEAQMNYLNALVDLRKAQLEWQRLNGVLLNREQP